jgi:hypothetical protein
VSVAARRHLKATFDRKKERQKMVKNRFEDDSNPLRDRIFEVLRNSSTSVEEDLTALLQCASQIRNRMLVEQTAKECGLKLSGFRTNDDLELYYDLRQGRHDVGYISKGWEDPGFRVGDLVEVPKANIPAVKAQAFNLLKFCATRGVVLTFEQKAGLVEIQMDSVIYSDGFNKKVFEQVLHYLNECVEKTHTTCGG